MTGRVQTLRSNVAGNRPTGRAPGELYVNWPDKQLGVVDSTATAVDLLAVRFFSPNTSYNQGDYVVQGGKLYTAKAAVPPGAFTASQWALTGGNVNVGDAPPATPDIGTMWFDSAGGQLYVWYNDGNTTQWVIATNAAKTDLSALLPLAGGTMTGPLTLAADPVNPMDATTKQYTDSLVRARNRIINGDMMVDQRNGGVPVNPWVGGYAIDRWRCNVTTNPASKGQAGQSINKATFPAPLNLGIQAYLGYQCLTAYPTPVAADQLYFTQFIEGCNFNDANWGVAGALPITLEFWAFSSLTGMFAGSIRGPTNRSYVFTYNLPTAQTWTKIKMVIPGDVAGGTWAVAATAASMFLSFSMCAGSTFQTPPNTWIAGNFFSASGAVNVLGTAQATFYVANVAVMVGVPPNAEPEFRKYSDSLIDCLRYYNKPDMTFIVTGYNNASAANYASWLYPVAMRAVPTVTPTAFGSAVNCSGLTVPSASATGFRASATVTAAGNATINFTATIEADF
jgi:hypothetical protein